MADGVLYLVDAARGLAFSSTERGADDEPLVVGTFRDGRVEAMFPYETNAEDHCETPLVAYEDVAPLLDRLRAPTQSRKQLRIYDPFFCDGAVKRHLASLGFTAVHNERHDFWRVVERNELPAFDVLVTNPPFSGDNIERLLAVCLGLNKPFLLLVPNWLYTKPYYDSLGARARAPLLVVPEKRYEFQSPAHLRAVKKAQLTTAPFVTIWFCFVPPALHGELANAYALASANRAPGARSVRLYRDPRDLPAAAKSSFDRSRKADKAQTRKKQSGKKRHLAAAAQSSAPSGKKRN